MSQNTEKNEHKYIDVSQDYYLSPHCRRNKMEDFEVKNTHLAFEMYILIVQNHWVQFV